MAGEVVQVAELLGRGRSLVAARPIKEGEIVLSDSPLLLYPPSLSALSSFCSHCFRSIIITNSCCPNCRVAIFCSPRCLSLSHPHLLCRALPNLTAPHNTNTITDDCAEQLLFLLSAYSLPSSSFLRLLSLSSPSPSPSPPSPSPSPSNQQQQEQVQMLHSLVLSLIPSHLLPSSFSPELTASLLAKERTNAFSLMEPFRPDVPQSLRRARAYAIYPHASLFNHDCLPNACHLDYVDRPGDNNTDIVVRALHDIPQGREVCLSYFAVNWNYADRQRKLLDDYGFRCECDRCRVESQWKQDDEADGDDSMEEEEEDLVVGDGMEEENADGGADEDFPHAYFFVRYLCDREHCGGMLAPLPPLPQGTPSHVLECNVCGQLRKEGDITQHLH